MNSLNTSSSFETFDDIDTPQAAYATFNAAPAFVERTHMCHCLQPIFYVVRYRLMPVLNAKDLTNRKDDAAEPADRSIEKPLASPVLKNESTMSASQAPKESVEH